MDNKTLLRTGITGSVIAAMCCATPVAAILLGVVGLSALCLSAGSAWSAPITFNTALPAHQGGWVLREHFAFMRIAGDPTSARRDLRVSGVVSVLGHGVSGDFALFGTLPWFDKRLDMTLGGQEIARRKSGSGDLTLLGRYGVYQHDAPGRTLRIAPFLGVKAPAGEVPLTLRQAMSRHKDIRYASRMESHIASQQQIHHLRHVVRELGRLLPERELARDEVKALPGWGCATVMHVLPLRLPPIAGEDHAKDIDFTPVGIRARWAAGRELAHRRIAEAPWRGRAGPAAGILVHD